MKKTVFIILSCTFVVLIAIFLIGRYGWQLSGFNNCESAGISQLNVENGYVEITGFYPGSFPEGFLGYHSEQVDGTLYIGFKFSGMFGIFETGDFNIIVPTEGTVERIVVKTGSDEYTVWQSEE